MQQGDAPRGFVEAWLKTPRRSAPMNRPSRALEPWRHSPPPRTAC